MRGAFARGSQQSRRKEEGERRVQGERETSNDAKFWSKWQRRKLEACVQDLMLEGMVIRIFSVPCHNEI